GGIMVGQPVEINLTWSTGYFEPIDSVSLANYLITTAQVFVSDGAQVDTLHLAFNPNKPIPVVWRGATIIGQVGHTYLLTVISEGRTATSTTTIYNPTPLDSTWFKLNPGHLEKHNFRIFQNRLIPELSKDQRIRYKDI
ncbi:MAG: hypothetical protein EBR87_10190, partial [Cytophagia bacterium]|nr:hypothetical protein [Cytophagia bacterium]